MPNYVRPKVAGATVFFTVCLAQRGDSLLIDHIDVLREAVRVTRARRPFEIEAWVVLPDHIHCIWTLPPNDKNFAHRWGAIKARFSKHVRRTDLSLRGGGVNPALRKGEVGIWQKRFWEHHIRGPQDFADHMQFCLSSPVRAGYVSHADDWPFSSLHRDMRRKSLA